MVFHCARSSGSCTSTLRRIRSARESGKISPFHYRTRDFAMIPQQLFYQLVVLGLLWLFVMLHYTWPSRCVASPHKPSKPLPPPRKRSSDPKPFPGLTRTPPCAACAQAHEHGPQPPGCPPPRMAPTRGRPRQVDTSH